MFEYCETVINFQKSIIVPFPNHSRFEFIPELHCMFFKDAGGRGACV